MRQAAQTLGRFLVRMIREERGNEYVKYAIITGVSLIIGLGVISTVPLLRDYWRTQVVGQINNANTQTTTQAGQSWTN